MLRRNSEMWDAKVEWEIIDSRSLRQTGAGSFDGYADEAYEAIRANSADIKAISEATGIKPSNIEKVKKHLVFDEHLLDRYVKKGVPEEVKRFDSDIGIGKAWKR